MPFQIVRNDITNIKADAIVNFVNSMPVYSRGADAAIYQKAGAKSLLAQWEKIGERKVGEAEITSAFGLKARFIIHTVGPCWQGAIAERRRTYGAVIVTACALPEIMDAKASLFL